MNNDTPITESRLSMAAFLLPALPAAVAAASFAHGHGALSVQALAMIIISAVAIGGWLGDGLLKSLTSLKRANARSNH